jgi:hypothetical protein
MTLGRKPLATDFLQSRKIPRIFAGFQGISDVSRKAQLAYKSNRSNRNPGRVLF